MDLIEARALLAGTIRMELRDHAFGDREVTWMRGEDLVAEGYFGAGIADVFIIDDKEPGHGERHFKNDDARSLLECGTLIVKRNDSIGPSAFEQDTIMPDLTKEGVLKELKGE